MQINVKTRIKTTHDYHVVNKLLPDIIIVDDVKCILIHSIPRCCLPYYFLMLCNF